MVYGIAMVVSVLGGLVLALGEVATFLPQAQVVSPAYIVLNSSYPMLVYLGVLWLGGHMLLACLFTLGQIRMAHESKLHALGTDASALLFYTMQVGRLTLPVCLKTLQMAGLRESALGRIVSGNQPAWLGFLFPAMLLLAGLLSCLRWWEKLAAKFQSLL